MITTETLAAVQHALIDAGVESWLERRFLELIREAGLPRPECQVIFRDGSRTVARVDFLFLRRRRQGNLVFHRLAVVGQLQFRVEHAVEFPQAAQEVGLAVQ